MKCGKCPYSTVDFTDAQDGYYCPFELKSEQPHKFFSGSDCSHDEERKHNDRFKFGYEVVLERINGHKNRSETVRKTIEKEWRKEMEYKGVATKIAEENALRFAQEKDTFVKRWLLRRGWDGKDMNQARELAKGYHIEEKWHQEDFGYTVTFTMCANDEGEKDK